MNEHTQAREPRQAMRGFFPVVAGNDVRVERGGGIIFLAKRHLSIEQGGGQWLLSTGTLDVRQGGGAALIAKEAHVSEGNVGVLIAGRATIAPGARVLCARHPPSHLRPSPALQPGGCLDTAARTEL
jgi:hypothetical protein